MNGQQQIVGLGGVALAGLNFWDKGRHTLAAGAFNSSASVQQTEAAHDALKNTALQLLFVGVATIVAGLNSSAGNAMVAVIVALAILWAVKHYSTTTNGSTK